MPDPVSYRRFPGPDTPPGETLRWVRRWELITGLACVVLGLALWGYGWWHWALLGVGVIGVSPWPGSAAILRRAEHDPTVLVTDPDRRRARARRATLFTVPAYALPGAVAGYVVGGWAVAVIAAVGMGLSAVVGAQLYLRSRDRPTRG